MNLLSFAKMFCREMQEIKALLSRNSSYGVGSQEVPGGEDLLLQYPESSGDLILAAGEEITHEVAINKKVMYLSVDAPAGLLVTLERDSQPFFFATDEIGALEFQAGIFVGTLKVTAVNSTEIDQKWSVRLLFH